MDACQDRVCAGCVSGAIIAPVFTPASILKETFGYDTFRPYQREVIENVLARKDSLAVMPTGGG